MAHFPQNNTAFISSRDSGTSQLFSLLKLPVQLKLPPLPEPPPEHYLFERYSVDSTRWKRRAYYYVKPFLPRQIQLRLRRSYARLKRGPSFPAWPVERVLVDQVHGYLRKVRRETLQGDLHRLSYWPGKARFCFVITHDVEWDSGLRHARALSDIESKLGFVSSWNIVPERYPIDWGMVDELRSRGCEIGVHGLRHDGKDFDSFRRFSRRVARMNEYGRRWGAVGFRAPATLRNVNWMQLLRFEYDSSFPDTDPYEPQPGGCCSIWPYFIGNLVELPLTMPQDHTLFEILGHSDLSVWEEKVTWIEENSGMVLVNVHPDYMMSATRLRLYEEFLNFMRSKEGMWHALPRDVASWWRERNATHLSVAGSSIAVQGPASARASILRITVDGEGTLHHEHIAHAS